MTKPKPLTEKQTHFLEAWGLPMQPSFGYAHGLINYLCEKPAYWSKHNNSIPRKQYTAHMVDRFWEFYTKWVGRDVLVQVRDKEGSTITKKAFKYETGVVVGVVGRPIGECAFIKSKFGYVTGHLKPQVLLRNEKKAKVVGVGKVAMVKYNGEMLSRETFYEHYKVHVENRNDTWRIKCNRGGKLLAQRLAAAAKNASQKR